MAYERYRCWILNNYSALGSGPHIDLLAGSAAGGTAVLCTYPLDLARTKLAYQVAILCTYFYSEVLFSAMLKFRMQTREVDLAHIVEIFMLN